MREVTARLEYRGFYSTFLPPPSYFRNRQWKVADQNRKKSQNKMQETHPNPHHEYEFTDVLHEDSSTIHPTLTSECPLYKRNSSRSSKMMDKIKRKQRMFRNSKNLRFRELYTAPEPIVLLIASCIVLTVYLILNKSWPFYS